MNTYEKIKKRRKELKMSIANKWQIPSHLKCDIKKKRGLFSPL